jgi:acyl dehydratase
MCGASRYFEDLPVGTELHTSARTITEGLVELYAGVSGDFSYVHTDAERAERGLFGERVAHGLLTLSVLQGLMWQTRYDLETGMATLAWNDVRFPAPVRFGDTVRGVFTIREARASRSRPDAGIVVESCRLVNQRDEDVLMAEHVLMLRRRPAD